MLSSALRRGVLICSNGIRTYARGRRMRDAMPGLQHRADALEEAGVKIPPDVDMEEILEESEADMNQMNKAYDHYVYETEMEHEKLKRNIVKQKYWDEATPNLLTWSEKEQIRYLINECGDEWTPERIAESFPVTAEVVKKLVKYPWKPSSKERIARHDASAMRNWRELKEGTLNIPEKLRERFLKFSERTIPPLKETAIKQDIAPEIIGEFQAIIEKSAAKERQKALLAEKREDKVLVIEDDSINQNAERDNIEITKRDHKRYTLDDLKHKIGRKMAAGKDISTTDKHLFTSEIPVDDAIAKVNTIEMEMADDKPSQVAIFKDQKITPVNIPDKIVIPQAAYKKGGTYRVNDCYYDHDGEFLYRVPGISEVSGIKQI